jgi:hypothetical protein
VVQVDSRLKSFIASVKLEGMARNSKFAVELTLPEQMRQNFNISSRLQTVLLFCDSAALPGINIATNANSTFGEVRETPYDRIFDTLSLSFYIDNSMVVKSLFDEWVNLIQNNQSRLFSYYEEYISKIVITTFDMKSRPRYKVMLQEAYPKHISSISLDYANRDIMKLNVTFMFKYYETIEVIPVNYAPDLVPGIFGAIGNILPSSTYINNFAGFQNQYAALTNNLQPESMSIFTGIT